jgi:hypothetical protein
VLGGPVVAAAGRIAAVVVGAAVVVMLGGHDPRSPFVRLMLIVCVISGRRPGEYLPPDEPTAGNEASRGATRNHASDRMPLSR